MPFSTNIYYHFYEGSPEGQRPAVVLLHGAGGNHLSWPAETRRMRGYRIFALDLPGHGKSGGYGLQSITAYAEAVLEFLASLNLHQVALVGHSMGAAIALHLALEYPQQVLGLGLVGAAARLKVDQQLLDHAASSTTYHNAVELLVRSSFSAAFPPALVEQVIQRMGATRPSVLRSDLKASHAWDESGRVSQIRCPTLIVCGSQDRLTPVRQAQFLQQAIAGSQLHVVEGAGHMPQLEQPQLFSGIVQDFLIDMVY